MPKRVQWTDNAKADVRALDRTTAMRVLHALARYAKSDQGDVKHLVNVDSPESRLRAGDYRVRFQAVDERLVIISVRHRREAYRDL